MFPTKSMLNPMKTGQYRAIFLGAALIAIAAVAGAGCGSSGNEDPDAAIDAEVVVDAFVQQDADLTRFDFPVKVVRIIDGDTISVQLDSGSMHVRLIGVDTPELTTDPPEPYALEARDFTAYYTEVGWVGLEFDDPACASHDPPAQCLDLYDRLLAYVRTYSGGDLGGMLIANGLARVYDLAQFSRKSDYQELEDQARAAGLGIWN